MMSHLYVTFPFSDVMILAEIHSILDPFYFNQDLHTLTFRYDAEEQAWKSIPPMYLARVGASVAVTTRS